MSQDIATNRKALHDFHILEKFEAGVELKGTEVKSIRAGHINIRDAFAQIHGRGLLGLQLPSATSLYEHLISPWGGLLVWAPLCLLGLLAGVDAARGPRGEPELAAGRCCIEPLGAAHRGRHVRLARLRQPRPA